MTTLAVETPSVARGTLITPVEPSRHQVAPPHGGATVVVPDAALAVLALCDGRRDVDGVVAAAQLTLGLSPVDARAWIEGMTAHGVLELTARQRALHTIGDIRHTCLGCGASCEAQLVGPLGPDTVASLRDHHRRLAADHARVREHPPFVKGRTPAGDELFFLNFPGKRCVFLSEDHACLVHRHFGAEAKPLACRSFPHLAIHDGADVRLGRRTLCYRAHERRGEGDVDADMIAARPNARAPLRVGSNTPDAQVGLDEARFHEAQITSWCQEADMTLPELVARLFGREPRRPPRDRLSASSARRLASLVRPLPGAMGAWCDGLQGTVHGAHVRGLLEGLELVGEREGLSLTTPLPAAWERFAIEGVRGFVALRETSRFPSVILGALAFALGGILAGAIGHHAAGLSSSAAPSPSPNEPNDPNDPRDQPSLDEDDSVGDRFAMALVAWNRMLNQSQAFVVLFPSPEAVSELASATE